MQVALRNVERKLLEGPVPKWQREMLRYYKEKGFFRPADLQKLLGDPVKAVTVGPSASIRENISQKR